MQVTFHNHRRGENEARMRPSFVSLETACNLIHEQAFVMLDEICLDLVGAKRAAISAWDADPSRSDKTRDAIGVAIFSDSNDISNATHGLFVFCGVTLR